MAASEATNDTERAFFEGFIGKQGDFNPFADRGWRTLAKRFRDLVKPAPGIALLDLGCGTGQSRRIYDGTFGRYVGVDLSPAAVAVAHREFPVDRWLVGDACALPFEDDQFDVVAFSSLLHHIPDYGTAVAEGWRVLKPGGTAFAFDPNLRHPAMALLRHPKSPLYVRGGVSPNERPLRPSALRRAFAISGFVAIRQRCQSAIPFRYGHPSFPNALMAAFNVADAVWQRIGAGRFLGTFVITVAEKPR